MRAISGARSLINPRSRSASSDRCELHVYDGLTVRCTSLLLLQTRLVKDLMGLRFAFPDQTLSGARK